MFGHENKFADQRSEGYPALAEFLSSDERWSIYRRFKYLQSRLILEKQEELRLLDEELRDMDLEVAQDEPHNAEAASKLNTRHRRNPEEAHSRSEYFEKAERLYKEYAALLGASRQMMALEKPAFHERKSVRHFISATKPVVQREAAWLEDPADLVTLRGVRPHATFNALLEAILTRAKHYLNPPRTIETWLAANVTAEKISNRVISLFLIVSVPTIFFAPIYILTVVAHNIGKGIAVLVVFALLFIFVLAIGTTAKSHEIWNSAAA